MLSGSGLELSWDQSSACQNEYLMIVSGNSSAVWTGCQGPLPPTLLFLDIVKVVFKGLQASGRRGFRLLFSFHNFSSLPEKVSLTKWNCSVPFFSDFMQHFPCDLVAQCVGGEDEMNCPYSKVCGSGYIFVGGMCLVYIVPDRSYSWNEASEACMIRDLRLATLNTRRKWKEVTSLMNLKSSSRVYVGLTSSLNTLPQMYKDTTQWTDGSIAYFVNVLHSTTKIRTRRMCAYLSRTLASGTDPSFLTYTLTTCASSLQAGVLCEKPGSLSQALPVEQVTIPSYTYKNTDWPASFSHVTCSLGHVAHEFLACDTKSSCILDDGDAETICPRAMLHQSLKTITRYDEARPPMFECASGADDVPYTLVCDRRPDCEDRSDEDFCLFPVCPVRVAFPCSYDQCVPMGEYCDGLEQCFNGADEDSCEINSLYRKDADISLPAIVNMTGKGSFNIEIHPDSGFACPPTHFRCPGDDVFCLPVFLRCNDVYDCPGHEDEARCDDYTCPGLYRCRGSRTCLHVTYLCDGVPQCRSVTTTLVRLPCPTGCTCYALPSSVAAPLLSVSIPTSGFFTLVA
ncbi:uncharacterized protein LOC112554826 [Pomacea canaliculata]|uniref:uncharacterized protein LOC112554826 n=1 Tax=Pomacea canaliculata TaxID=400727 RepID=UPI000D730262|nr:uncharacterized protein LOC112554826 [Pomacea canaliculata]